MALVCFGYETGLFTAVSKYDEKTDIYDGLIGGHERKADQMVPIAFRIMFLG